MDYDYCDVKPDEVKLESELILKDDVETDINFSGASHHHSSAAFAEESSAFPERNCLNFVHSFCALDPAPDKIQDVSNVTVKIKEESTEDVTPSAGPNYEFNREVGSASWLKLNSGVHLKGTEHNSVNDFSSAARIKSENNSVQGLVPCIKVENAEDEVPSTDLRLDDCHPNAAQIAPSEYHSVFFPEEISIKSAETFKGERYIAMEELPQFDFVETDEERIKDPFHDVGCHVSTQCSAKCDERLPSCELLTEQSPRIVDVKKKLVSSPDSRSFSCDQSPSKFKQKSKLKRRAKKAFPCDLCSATFSRKSDVKRHNLIYTGEEIFSCDQCPAKFCVERNFERHNRIHSGEKAFSCDQCPAKFSRKCNLQTHSMTHSSEKAFSCDQCPAKFRQKGQVKRHSLIHSGEKPFSCDQCSAKFTMKCNLQRHSLSHSSEEGFFCDQCPAKFCDKANLRRHSLIHSGEKAYACDQCPRTFSQKIHRDRHSLIHSCVRGFS